MMVVPVEVKKKHLSLEVRSVIISEVFLSSVSRSVPMNNLHIILYPTPVLYLTFKGCEEHVILLNVTKYRMFRLYTLLYGYIAVMITVCCAV
jgi:hypothetical protein